MRIPSPGLQQHKSHHKEGGRGVMDWGPYNSCVLHYALFIVHGPMRLLLCKAADSWLACLWACIYVFAVHMI